MKITIEFKSVDEYLEFKKKTAQEEQVQEQSTVIVDLDEKFAHKVIEQINSINQQI